MVITHWDVPSIESADIRPAAAAGHPIVGRAGNPPCTSMTFAKQSSMSFGDLTAGGYFLVTCHILSGRFGDGGPSLC